MAEYSRPWAGTSPGDAGPYSNEHWAEIWSRLWVQNPAEQGIVLGVMGEFEIAGIASPITVASGAAMVDGNYYANDTPVSITIPLPLSNSRIDLIVLRKSWSAQTVRITRIDGIEGGGVPDLVQVQGVTWDIPLAQVEINTDGDISITPTLFPIISPLLANLFSDTLGGLFQFGSISNRQFLFRNGSTVEGRDSDFILPFVVGNGKDNIDTSVPIAGDLEVPVNCTITGYVITATSPGSITLDVWKSSYADAPPTVANSITGSEKIILSSSVKNRNLTVSTWDTDLVKGDILRFNIDSAGDDIKQAHIFIHVSR